MPVDNMGSALLGELTKSETSAYSEIPADTTPTTEDAPALATRIESIDYIVRCTAAKVFSKPHSGIVVGERLRGTLIGTTLRTSGDGPNDGWVRLNEVIPASESGEGWCAAAYAS